MNLWAQKLVRVTLVVVLGSSVSPALAQRSEGNPVRNREAKAAAPEANVRLSIENIYREAEKVTTVQDCTRVLLQCRDLFKTQLSKANQDYVLQLASWLYVRRGELISTRAGQFSDGGQSEQAAQLEKRAIQDFGNAIKSCKTCWRAHHNRGVSYSMLGDYENALKDFDAAIQLNPNKFANSFYNRAEIYFELEDFTKAERDYDISVRLAPDDSEAIIGRAHARHFAGKTDLALRDLDKVLQLNPDNAEAYADRADIFAYQGEWEKAANDYRMAINLDKNLGRAYLSVAWLMSTCPEERYRHSDFAVQAANRAIELDGTGDYRYLDTLAAAQANSNDFENAKRTIQKALKVAPQGVEPGLQERLAMYGSGKAFRDLR